MMIAVIMLLDLPVVTNLVNGEGESSNNHSEGCGGSAAGVRQATSCCRCPSAALWNPAENVLPLVVVGISKYQHVDESFRHIYFDNAPDD